MSKGPTYSVSRNGGGVTVWIEDRRKSTERNALDMAQRALQPWETVTVVGHDGTTWLFEVEAERSARRKSVLDTILCEMDQTDAAEVDLPTVETYLADIATLLEVIE